VIPGSGCTGLAPIARNYFRGLERGAVTVLHKRHVHARDWPAPSPCSPRVVRDDRLSQALADADAFLAAHRPADGLPAVLVGISEGAELVPLLAQRQRWITQVALVASTGLDPLESYRLQTRRQGEPEAFDQMQAAAAEPGAPDAAMFGGRTLGYWRDLLRWPVTRPLMALEQPVWIGFGGEDRALALEGLGHLAVLAPRPLCIAIFAGAGHGLLRGGDEPLQQFWAWLEAAVLRHARPEDCAPLPAPNLLR
jgi:hypothetical protein